MDNLSDYGIKTALPNLAHNKIDPIKARVKELGVPVAKIKVENLTKGKLLQEETAKVLVEFWQGGKKDGDVIKIGNLGEKAQGGKFNAIGKVDDVRGGTFNIGGESSGGCTIL